MVRKMKAIYHTLNLFNVDVTKKCLIGECWIPTKNLNVVSNELTTASVCDCIKYTNVRCKDKAVF